MPRHRRKPRSELIDYTLRLTEKERDLLASTLSTYSGAVETLAESDDDRNEALFYAEVVDQLKGQE